MQHETELDPDFKTLVIAFLIAKRDGRSQAAAIRKSARRLRDSTKNVELHGLLKQLIKADDDTNVVQALVITHNRLIGDGFIDGRVING